MVDHLATLAELCARAGLHFERRDVLLALAARGEVAGGVLTARATVAELASDLGVALGSFKRQLMSAPVTGLGLPWLEVAAGRQGYRLVVHLDGIGIGSGSHPDHIRISSGSVQDQIGIASGSDQDRNGIGSGSHPDRIGIDDPSRIRAEMSHAPAPASLAPTLYESSRSGRPAAHVPTHAHEAAPPSAPASQPAEPLEGEGEVSPEGDSADAGEGFAAWLANELANERDQLARGGGPLSADSVSHAATRLLRRCGDEATARALVEDRLLSQLARSSDQRAGTLATALQWLVADAAEPRHLDAARAVVAAANAPRSSSSAAPPRQRGRARQRWSAPTYEDRWDYSDPSAPQPLTPRQEPPMQPVTPPPAAQRAPSAPPQALPTVSPAALTCADLIAGWSVEAVRAELALHLAAPPSRRDTPLLEACAARLGLSPDALDDPWRDDGPPPSAPPVEDLADAPTLAGGDPAQLGALLGAVVEEAARGSREIPASALDGLAKLGIKLQASPPSGPPQAPEPIDARAVWPACVEAVRALHRGGARWARVVGDAAVELDSHSRTVRLWIADPDDLAALDGWEGMQARASVLEKLELRTGAVWRLELLQGVDDAQEVG